MWRMPIAKTYEQARRVTQEDWLLHQERERQHIGQHLADGPAEHCIANVTVVEAVDRTAEVTARASGMINHNRQMQV